MARGVLSHLTPSLTQPVERGEERERKEGRKEREEEILERAAQPSV